MMGALPGVSVVIPSYQRCAHLLPVIEPLLADDATTEVVVVVDGSSDGSYELLRDRAVGDGRLRPILTENRGQAAAQQLGVEVAVGEVVLLLDDDVVPCPGLVSGHAAHHEGTADVVVTGYMPVDPRPTSRPEEWIRQRYAMRYEAAVTRWEEAPERLLLELWGGNVSVGAANLRRIPVRRTDSELRYHMDLDFGIRCWKAGLEGHFDRALAARHLYLRSVSQFLADRAKSATDRALLHTVHRDVLGPLPENYFRVDAGAFARSLLRLADGHSRCMEGLLEVGVRFESVAKRYRAEALTADLLDRMRGQRLTQRARWTPNPSGRRV
jgi:glycosyltransferase involved in cell wall biosynthesis